jgi:serine/threonine protein phosphatase PrpC
MDTLPTWRAIGKSVRGANHFQTSIPNQDAIGWWTGAQDGLPLIMAISDGHGGERSFRSNRGSRIAVQITLQVLQEFIKGLPDLRDLVEAEHMAAAELPQTILKCWEQEVKADLETNPFQEQELKRLLEKRGTASKEMAERYPLLVYGATILATVVTQYFILHLQLGDGDILCVDPNGKTYRPYPRDERLIDNETTSLCSLNAADFRLRLEPVSKNGPVMVLMVSDGFSNSFPDEEELLKAGIEYLQSIRLEGMDAINENLDATLKHISRLVSGDDISLGLLKRSELLDYDNLMTRFALVDAALASLRSDFSSVIGQVDYRKQLEEIRQKLNALSSSLSKMDTQSTALQELMRQLEAFAGGEMEPLRELEKRLSTVEGHELAIDGRQTRLEQVFYELRTGLEEYHAELSQRIQSMSQQIQALQEQNQQMARHWEERQPRLRNLQGRLQQQEQALRNRSTIEKQIRWLSICVGILAGLSLAALGIAIFLR